MRCIVEFHEQMHPPLLRLYIHGAPHRRQHTAVIQRYRDELVAAGRAAGLRLPIRIPIDLRVTFINPCSPDLDNLIVALYRAMDGASHASPTLIEDDGLIQDVSMGKFFPHEVTKADRPIHGRTPIERVDNDALRDLRREAGSRTMEKVA
jgi:Holliday junction resolvase RusA-like endonuclease